MDEIRGQGLSDEDYRRQALRISEAFFAWRFGRPTSSLPADSRDDDLDPS